MRKDEVERFLSDFRVKKNLRDILFRRDREKNSQTISDLELSIADLKRVVDSIDVPDYSEGPITERMYGGTDMWVFGKVVKGHEVYIKITLGAPSSATICISFHISEHAMRYPFKESKKEK